MNKELKEKGRIALKNKGEIKNRYNKYMIYIIFFFIVGYGFFFSARFWYEDESEMVKATEMFTIKSWNNRKIELVNWNYSEQQKVMEIQLSIENNSHDGIDTYHISALDRRKGNIKTEVILNENNFWVVRLVNVPEKWSQILLKIAFEDDIYDSCKLYTNKYAVTKVDKIEDLTFNQYMTNRLDSLILKYQDMIEELNSSIEDEEIQIANYNLDIENYNAKKEYQTARQKEETEKYIQQLKSSIKGAESRIITHNEDIKEYNERITLLEKQKQEYAD